MHQPIRPQFVLGVVLVLAWSCAAVAQESKDASTTDTVKVTLAGGQLVMQAPAMWKQVEPAISMIEAEFAIEPEDGDEQAGRLTIMTAGGSVEANIDRWIGQFVASDGGNPADSAKIEEKDIGGAKVHLVDISGTYRDQRGPQAPATDRAGYRLLGAIIESPSAGTYFVKFYGPEKTVGANAERFQQFIASLESK